MNCRRINMRRYELAFVHVNRIDLPPETSLVLM
ncbi:hypothetical protein FIU92_01935 [Ruegeria sp. THAF33]|nr:hypothetical protein FIU92_01935 [Ruegeria sp. THAF33]